MKNLCYILGGLMIMLLTACTQEEWTDNNSQQSADKAVSITAYAPGDGTNTRVAFDGNGTGGFTLSWNKEESFSVIRGSENQLFTKNAEGNIFQGTLPTQGTGNYYALYPVNGDATDAAAVPFDLSTQTGELNGSKPYMYATLEEGSSTLTFKHCTAILKATFSELPQDAKIKKVVITTVDAKVKGTLNLTDGTMTGNADNSIEDNRIAINYTDPVDATTPVYVYLPPMDADSKTLTFEVTTGADEVYSASLEGEDKKAIEAGKLYTATIKLIPYLTFRAASGQTMTITDSKFGLTANGTDGKERVFEYSLNGGKWTRIEPNTAIYFTGDNSTIRLRGKSIDGTATSLGNYSQISFGNSTIPVACTGDIRTLLDYDSYVTVKTVGARFYYLFRNCKALTSAPALPATDLAASCYEGMFENCTALTTAPALPATNLAGSCYSNMFKNCTALTTAPALPATTLANHCYYSMFNGCTSLTTAPELEATELAKYCYSFMFFGCTSLTSAPVLPAKKMAESCYRKMFEGCTSLTSAPALEATELAKYCYSFMFQNCTSLNSVTMLATNIDADGCLFDWLNGVAANGTFTKAASMDTLPEGASGIPTGWKVESYSEP